MTRYVGGIADGDDGPEAQHMGQVLVLPYVEPRDLLPSGPNDACLVWVEGIGWQYPPPQFGRETYVFDGEVWRCNR